MLAIKFKRVGKKGQASFRIVVAEKRSKLQGRYIEDLGWFNPHTDGIGLNREKIEDWMAKGARPTDSVFNLLVKAGILAGPKKPVHGRKNTGAAGGTADMETGKEAGMASVGEETRTAPGVVGPQSPSGAAENPAAEPKPEAEEKKEV